MYVPVHFFKRYLVNLVIDIHTRHVNPEKKNAVISVRSLRSTIIMNSKSTIEKHRYVGFELIPGEIEKYTIKKQHLILTAYTPTCSQQSHQ
jgi:hypothetical protein